VSVPTTPFEPSSLSRPLTLTQGVEFYETEKLWTMDWLGLFFLYSDGFDAPSPMEINFMRRQK